MLNLQTRVHFKEIELARCVSHQKLNCSRSRVVHSPRELDRSRAHLFTQRRVVDWRGTFLDHLLMTPLNRTLALAQMHDVTVRVCKYLYLDVARALDRLLQIK